jgi:hypothetical protein
MHKALDTKGLVQILSSVVNYLQDPVIPPRGLETVSTSRTTDNKLGQTSFQSGAESGAVSTETPSGLTAEALAAALMALSPADRARLAALLTGEQTGHAKG